jgi:hypothetical protein
LPTDRVVDAGGARAETITGFGSRSRSDEIHSARLGPPLAHHHKRAEESIPHGTDGGLNASELAGSSPGLHPRCKTGSRGCRTTTQATFSRAAAARLRQLEELEGLAAPAAVLSLSQLIAE